MKKLTLILCLLIFCFSSVFAQTEISGEIGSQYWFPEDGPFIIIDNTTVVPGAVLYILPGVTVMGFPEKKIDIQGSIQAIGTEEDSIFFTSYVDTRWDGFELHNTTKDCNFEYCFFEMCGVYNGRMHGGVFTTNTSTVSFDHCDFYNNISTFNSSCVYSLYSNVHMMNCKFWGNYSQCSCVVGGDLAGLIELKYCLFYDNSSGVGPILTTYPHDYVVDHCTIADNWAEFNDRGTVFYTHEAVNWEMTNSIIVSDMTGYYVNPWAIDNVTANYTCLDPNQIDGEHQLYENPMFVDAENRDYHLQDDSPCIDAGDPYFPLDADGTITDLGCFPNLDGVSQSHTVTFDLPEMIVETGEVAYLPVHLRDDVADYEIYGIYLTIDFPLDNLTVLDVVPYPGSQIDDDLNWVTVWATNENQLLIATEGVEFLSSPMPLYQIVVQVSENAPLATSDILTYSDARINNLSQRGVRTENGTIYYSSDFIYGDVNLNLQVENNDYNLLWEYFSGITDLEDIQRLLSDVSGNGRLMALDMALIQDYCQDEITEFPVDTGIPFPSGTAIAEVQPYTYIDANTGMVEVELELTAVETVHALTFDIAFDENIMAFEGIEDVDFEHILAIDETPGLVKVNIAFDDIISEDIGQIIIVMDAYNYTSPTTVRINSLHLNETTYHERVMPTMILEDFDVEENDTDLPVDFVVSKVWPNPFNSLVNVNVQLSGRSDLDVSVYNILGQKVATLATGDYSQGVYNFSWNAVNQSAGTYFAQVKTEQKEQVLKLLLLK